MKIPDKIGIIDNAQSALSRLRFGQWEGYDSALQRKYLALKINEILDFLEGHPEFSNDFAPKLEEKDGQAVHVHEWEQLQRFGTRALFSCKVCGEQEVRLIPQNIF